MRTARSLEGQLYRIGLISLIAGFLLVLGYLHFMVPKYTFPCVILNLFGVYCPGCGGTRAVEALLQGDFLLSLWYHPMVLYGAVVFTGFMGTQTLEKLHIGRIKGWKFHTWYLYGAVAIVMGNWILKNILLLVFHITL